MSTTPEGWYPDPHDPGMRRYWDGKAWTEHRVPAQGTHATAPVPPPPAAKHTLRSQPLGALADIYRLQSLDQLTPDQREQLMNHRLTSFPTWLLIVLHFLTLGLFTMIYQGLHFSKLPHAKHDDFDSGKAIGFMFIPFYNYYWVFRFVHSLIDRVNLQLRLRGEPPRISRGLGTAACICHVIPYLGIFISYLFLIPIVAGEIQSNVNRLAKERDQQPFGSPRVAMPPPRPTT